MKSKLLKLKKKTAKEWCILFCRMSCIAAICSAIVVGKYLEASFVTAIWGWYKAYQALKTARVCIDDLSNTNDKLIVINKELSDLYNEQLCVAQGMISENKELKMKLKNAKMENSRIRKGGRKHE